MHFLPFSRQGRFLFSGKSEHRRRWMRIFLTAVYLLLFTAAYWLAFSVRFEFQVPRDWQRVFWETLAWVLAVKMFFLYSSGQFHVSFRQASFADLISLVKVSALSLLVIVAVDHFLLAQQQIPRATLALDAVFIVALLGGVRACGRLCREQWRVLNASNAQRALIVGSGEAAEALARQLHAQNDLPYRVVGFLDDDRERIGLPVAGIPVVGRPRDVDDAAEALQARDVLVMSGTLPGKELRILMERCRESGLQLRVLPTPHDLLANGQRLFTREVDIQDLLRRDPIELDCDAIQHLLANRTIFVTGAGGSIGSEICRQLLKFHPARLVLIDRNETALFHLEHDLRPQQNGTALFPRVGDIADGRRMRRLFEAYQPEVVFHAAAYKHVPMMEDNIGEAVKNNVGGTRNLARIADEFGVAHFVMISTDKAVHPSSVMGATKHLAERYVHALSDVSETRFVIVRFGNVLGSAGSVVPLFQKQLMEGGPLTVTHPEMTRFFMTIPEASQLVLQAAALGKGGEIFVLEMGEPVKILDLARDVIRLSGYREEDIGIVFSGPRPGEKLYEELYLDEEELLPSPHGKLHVVSHQPMSHQQVTQDLDELLELVDGPDDVLQRRIRSLVHGYSPPQWDAPPSRNGHGKPARMSELAAVPAVP